MATTLLKHLGSKCWAWYFVDLNSSTQATTCLAILVQANQGTKGAGERVHRALGSTKQMSQLGQLAGNFWHGAFLPTSKSPAQKSGLCHLLNPPEFVNLSTFILKLPVGWAAIQPPLSLGRDQMLHKCGPGQHKQKWKSWKWSTDLRTGQATEWKLGSRWSSHKYFCHEFVWPSSLPSIEALGHCC